MNKIFPSTLASSVLAVCFAVTLSSTANAVEACDLLGGSFYRYSVDEFGDGTCRTAPNDFLGGTGVANCTLASNGNINCRCKGTLVDIVVFEPGDGAIVGNVDDKCCVVGGITNGYALLGIAPRGVATPSHKINATCRIRNQGEN